MPKKKIYYRHEIPSSVVNIVKSVCADYDRRALLIRSGAPLSQRYVELNGAIDRALEFVECGIRRTILDDIHLGRGYGYSPASAILSKNAYYARKVKAVYMIACELKLL
jgi:hypothetical protein